MNSTQKIMNYLPAVGQIQTAAIVSSKVVVVALSILAGGYAALRLGSSGMSLFDAGHVIKAGFMLGAAAGVTMALFCNVFPNLNNANFEKMPIFAMFKSTDENMKNVAHYIATAFSSTLLAGVAIGWSGAIQFFAYNYFCPLSFKKMD